MSKPASKRSSFHLTVSITSVATAVRPVIKPSCITRNMPASAGALFFLQTEAWMEVKTAVWAMPVPKPPGKM